MRVNTSIYKFIYIFLILSLLTACNSAPKHVLRLATTTSTADSGLLDKILPEFESETDTRVDVIAVGTGQAIAIGAAGDVDVILVHAPEKEAQFISEGYGTQRYDVMYNDFVIVGPPSDPASIRNQIHAGDAFQLIANSGSLFASRGDNSGTHIKEQSIWKLTNFMPDQKDAWYKSLGQGMGATLQYANEMSAYALSDRGTFLSMRDALPNLDIMVGGNSIQENKDELLYNPYGVIPVNPKLGDIQFDLAMSFVQWITSIKTQQMIANFGLDTAGQPLFYPNSDEWHQKSP